MKHASTKNTGHARGNAEKGKKVPPFAGASILNDKKDVKRLMQAPKKSPAPLVKLGKARRFQLAPELLVKIHDYMVGSLKPWPSDARITPESMQKIIDLMIQIGDLKPGPKPEDHIDPAYYP